MTWSRREFVKAGTALVALNPFSSVRLSDAMATVGGGAAVTAGRMAFTPATAYRPYISRTAKTAETTSWVQIDLRLHRDIEKIRLYPAFGLGEKHMAGYGFPVRFKIECAEDKAFQVATTIVDRTSADFPNPDDQIIEYANLRASGRYVRITAVKLGRELAGDGFSFALSKIDVISQGENVAIAAPAAADDNLGNEKEVARLTRPVRPMGEGIVTDNPENVIPAAKWSTVPCLATTPLGGVSLEPGVFLSAMENNIGYLLGSFSVEEMLRPFRERADKPVRPGLREPIAFWDTELLGSSAGRFLMGAGNTLRWIEHEELRNWLNTLVDGIEECRQPNGFIMAYPEDSMFVSERGAYTRAWLTHGLIEAGYSGNSKAFLLLRGHYDWFDKCSYLPELLRGAAQGAQGMVANTRMYFTPVGKPEDIQVVQRHFQENYWLAGLTQRDTKVVWQYPYDRPHNYLITDFEAYLDIYRATGDKRYLEAMKGAWDLYHDHWEHVGGSIAITEFGEFPPGSYRLKAQFPFCETGETCGSVFWTRLNQRFHLIFPEEEKFVSEIEKSIYNVGMANQIGNHGIIYHARLVGQKGDLHVPLCTNSCCEGQGTRLLGSIPEYIYSISNDGIYIDLFAPSIIRWTRPEGEATLVQSTAFPFDPDVKLQLKLARESSFKIKLRVPSWSATPMAIHVNGKEVGKGQPGTYFTLDRTWEPDDSIVFTLPMDFKLTRYTGLDKIEGHERYALEYGPILLALIGSDDAVLKVKSGTKHADILKQLRPNSEKPLEYEIDGHEGLTYIPYWKVLNEPFTCFPAVDLA